MAQLDGYKASNCWMYSYLLVLEYLLMMVESIEIWFAVPYTAMYHNSVDMLHKYLLTHIVLSWTTIVVHSRDNQELGVAHKVKSPENQP